MDPISEPSAESAPPTEPRLRLVSPGDDVLLGDLPGTFSPDIISDDELIAALVAGEVAALAALYERHAHLVFAMLVRVVRDRDVAEDLLQEAFLRAWQHAHIFDETRGTARGWLARIAHNLALNELRRQRRRPQAQHRPASADVDDDDTAVSATGSDPADDAWCAIRDDGLAQAVSELPAGQQAVLTLYAAGFSQSEIAAKLDQPLGTVKSRMRRALGHLRQALPTIGIDGGWRAD